MTDNSERNTPVQKHYPVEFGPSDARRLECACGNADPGHADASHRPSKEQLYYFWTASGMCKTYGPMHGSTYVASADFERLTRELSQERALREEAERYAEDREQHTAIVARGGEIIIAERDRLRGEAEVADEQLAQLRGAVEEYLAALRFYATASWARFANEDECGKRARAAISSLAMQPDETFRDWQLPSSE